MYIYEEWINIYISNYNQLSKLGKPSMKKQENQGYECIIHTRLL